MSRQHLGIMFGLIFCSILVITSAQSTSTSSESTNASPSLNPKPTQQVITTAFAGSKSTTSRAQDPTTSVAATVQSTGAENPTAVPSAAPSSAPSAAPSGTTAAASPPKQWSPADAIAILQQLTGKVNAPELPYDPQKSQMTLRDQLLQQQQQNQQQQQQAPVEYDMFGFPINNAADNFDPFAGLFDFGAPTQAPPADPFFGSFGGAVGGSNQGGMGQDLFGGPQGGQGMFGGPSGGLDMFGGFGGGGGGGQQNPMGNMMQAMMLMQLLGGGDAPDPPATPAGGRGARGRGGRLSQLSPLERAVMMESRRQLRRENLRNQHMMNRPYPGNQPQWQQGPPNQGPGPWNRPPPPPPASWEGPPRAQRSSPRRAREVMARKNEAARVVNELPPASTKSIANPQSGSQSSHPAVLDRSNMVTPKPTPQTGQEPIEREGGRAQKGRKRFSSPPGTRTPPQSYTYTSAPVNRAAASSYTTAKAQSQGRGFSQQTYSSPAYPQTTPSYQGFGPNSVTPTPAYDQTWNAPNNDPFYTANSFNQGSQTAPGRNIAAATSRLGATAVPRNIQQLMSSPQFRRNLRTSGTFPGANPADVQADRADLMADRMDNLQSMSPLQRLLNAQMGGAMGGMMGGGLGDLMGGGMGGGLGGLMGGSMFGGGGSNLLSSFSGFGASPFASRTAGRRASPPRRPTQLDSVLGNLFG